MEYPFKDLLPLDEVLEREGYYKDWTHLDPEVFYSLTQISEYIKTKGFGVDVRLLIAQLAEHFSLKTSQINEIELFFKDVMQELSEDKDFYSLPEIASARRGYTTLAESLQNLSTSMLNPNLGKLTQVHLSDELLAQIAGNAPINAVPADGSLTTSKYSDGSVSMEKTNFIDVSTNLVNIEDADFKKGIDSSTGEVVDVTVSRYVTQFFDIEPNTEYSRNATHTIAFYDKDLNFIYSNRGSEGVITSPDKAYFARVASDKPNEVQLNKGATLLPYEKYRKPKLSEEIEVNKELADRSVTGDKIKLKEIGEEHLSIVETSSNLVDKNELARGYTTSGSTGEVVDSPTNSVTPFISVKPNTNYIANNNRYTEYDKDFNFIYSATRINGSPEHFTTNEKTMYLRLTYYNVVQADYPQLNEGTEILPYEEHYTRIKPQLIPNNPDQQTPTTEPYDKYTLDVSIDGTFDTSETYPTYTKTGLNNTTSAEIYTMFDDLMTEYPDYITKTESTVDGLGNEISLYKFTPIRPDSTIETDIPKVFLTCGTHGHEHITTIITYHMLKHICERWNEYPLLEALRFNVEFLVIPVLNPSGWDVFERRNHRGVDLNRNMPTTDWSSGSIESSTYGGSEPLSEIETQFVKKVIDENPDIDMMFDFHNFHGTPETTNFLWTITDNKHMQHLSQNLISAMTRKWTQEYSFIPKNDYFSGYTSSQVGGLIGDYAKERGISNALTFEVCWRWRIDPDSVAYDNNAITTGVEALTNWLLINLRDIT